MLVNIANEQVWLGHDVEIIIVERDAIDMRLRRRLDSRIKILEAHRRKNRKDPVAVAKINWFLLKARPDAIHIHSSGLMRSILLPWHRRITCSTLHDLPFDGNTVAIASVPRVFSISEAVQRQLKEKYRVESQVIHNGIYPEKVKVRSVKDKSDDFRIVMVSRLDHQKKGQDILIDALSMLKTRGFENITLDFIGDGESGIFLQHLCEERGLNEKVRFLGTKTQEYIFEHLAEYDLFVQPSRKEGFALTVAEAMAARVPVLVSSGQGPEEVVEYGRCGYIFKNGDSADCAKKIEQCILAGEDENMTERACKRVWTLYNVKETARQYLDNYFYKRRG